MSPILCLAIVSGLLVQRTDRGDQDAGDWQSGAMETKSVADAWKNSPGILA
jgi:hypothetical protein